VDAPTAATKTTGKETIEGRTIIIFIYLMKEG